MSGGLQMQSPLSVLRSGTTIGGIERFSVEQAALCEAANNATSAHSAVLTPHETFVGIANQNVLP